MTGLPVGSEGQHGVWPEPGDDRRDLGRALGVVDRFARPVESTGHTLLRGAQDGPVSSLGPRTLPRATPFVSVKTMLMRVGVASRRHCERGQTSAEYVGLLAFVAAVVLLVIAAGPGIGGAVTSKITAAIEGVAGGGNDPGAPGDPSDPSLDPAADEGSDGSFLNDFLKPAFEGVSGSIGYLQSQRDRVSTLGRLLSTHPDFHVRSAAGRLLPSLGSATRYGRSPLFRGISRAMPVLGFGIGTAVNLADGQSPFEAATRSALTTGGGVLAGMGATAAVCGAAAVATAGVGGLICGGAVLGAGVLGGLAGDFVGDVLFSDSAKEFYSDVGDLAGDVWDGAGDVAGDVGDALTFWD